MEAGRPHVPNAKRGQRSNANAHHRQNAARRGLTCDENLRHRQLDPDKTATVARRHCAHPGQGSVNAEDGSERHVQLPHARRFVHGRSGEGRLESTGENGGRQQRLAKTRQQDKRKKDTKRNNQNNSPDQKQLAHKTTTATCRPPHPSKTQNQIPHQSTAVRQSKVKGRTHPPPNRHP